MEITENLELDQEDIERILDPYLRSYKYYSKGALPGKIIIKKVEKISFQSGNLPLAFTEIPVVFKEEPKEKKPRVTVTVATPPATADKEEEKNAPSGPERAEQHSRPAEPISPSVDTEPEPN